MTAARLAAFFDVDGTLVKCQTQQQLTHVLFKERLLSRSQVFRIFYWYVCYRLSLIKSSAKIRRTVYKVFALKPKIEIDQWMEHAFRDYIAPQKNAPLQDCVLQHKSEGHYVCAISGTLGRLCALVCESFGIENYFATELLIQNDKYTGLWQGRLLEGEEKARLVQNLAKELRLNLDESYAYADSFADIPFLQCVGNPVVVGGDRKLLSHAKKSGWRVYESCFS